MTAPELRPYQREVIEQFHGAVAAGKRRIILVAPTGSGKTVIGADIINTTTRAQKPVLVLAHRREIITQTADKLRANGIYPGIIMAGVQPRPLELVQVAIDPDPVGAQPAHREDGPAARRSAGGRRVPPRAGEDLSEDHRPPIPTRCCSA